MRTLTLLAVVCCVAVSSPAPAADGTSAQQRAAEEYLAALATGDAFALAQTIHQDELTQLRTQLLEQIRLEAERGESLTRTRVFGPGLPLAELERLTPQNFFVALARRLRFGGREFERVEWLAAVPDSGSMVQMVGRLRPSRERGTVRVPVLVTLVPWGRDWKAALPLELQAQIEDLRSSRGQPIEGRGGEGRPQVAGAGGDSGAGEETPAVPRGILELFRAAEENLLAARCEQYYEKQMSPNFRRTTGARALSTLVSACGSREALREQLIAAIRIARARAPRYEYAGTRAVYDLSGQGLPFTRMVLEQVGGDWYIAE